MNAKTKRKSQGGRTILEVRGPAPEPEPTDPNAETAEEEALEDALGELPQGTVAKLYRIEEDGTKSFVAQTAPEAMTEERIARSGPGNYVVVFWGPLGDGTNRKGYKGRRSVRVAEGAKAFTGPVSNADGSLAHDPMSALIQNQFIKMLEMQDKSRQIEMTLLERLANRPERDWTPIIAAVAPIVGSIVTALLGRKDPVEIAAEIQKLTPAVEKTDQLANFKAIMELVRDLTPEGGGEGGGSKGPWWEAPAERIVTALLQGQQQGASVQSEPSAAPVQIPALPPQETSSVGMIERLIQQHGPTMLMWAQQDRPPSWAADTLLFEVPPGLHRQVATRLQTEPGIINSLIATYPPFGEYRAWLEELRDEIISAIMDDGGEAADRDVEIEPTPKPKPKPPKPKKEP